MNSLNKDLVFRVDRCEHAKRADRQRFADLSLAAADRQLLQERLQFLKLDRSKALHIQPDCAWHSNPCRLHFTMHP